ncbi:tetratricopeptide repeat protein [Sediminispirochaeta bajacaliforniensis]|uniref:tetratricopeptide repeat protein n=1 Tax=Sediminispirochaeta bajacaliforniensis TaxID=148 RepID=UPI001FDF4CED|nr:tetratricopeptide repeat protein [Sediminispirochaeta bajacaliforniensis]
MMSESKRIVPFLLLLFIAGSLPLFAQEAGAGRMKSALEAFGSGAYQDALLGFREVILDNDAQKLHGAAYYWLARSEMALKNYDDAARDLEYFLENFPKSSFYREGSYWKGRLLFLQNDFDNAIRALYDFIEAYPDHEFVANAYYWIGESLFALGHLEKAQRIFNLIITDYPASFKVEASRYRLSLIEMKEREEELMRLLKMSHEEYLSALEEFQRREKMYDQAISGYQRKLTALTANDKEALVQELSSDLDAKEQEIADLKRQISQLSQRINEGVGSMSSPVPETADSREELLSLKMKALTLKELYIEWLLDQEEGK